MSVDVLMCVEINSRLFFRNSLNLFYNLKFELYFKFFTYILTKIIDNLKCLILEKYLIRDVLILVVIFVPV